MFDRKGIAFIVCLLIFTLTWFTWGIPTSLLLRSALGLHSPWDTGDIKDVQFFVIFRFGLFLVSLFGLCIAAGVLLFYPWMGGRKKWLLTILLTLLLSQVFWGTVSAYYPEWSSIIMFTKQKSGTEYAPDFSISKLRSVTLGMKREAVTRAIGRGFKEWNGTPIPDDSSIWLYSRPKGRCENYWKARVHFGSNVVNRISLEFWVD